MGDLTAHFSAYEFKCRDGSEHPMDCGLLAMLEAIRCNFESPVVITSGYRSLAYNRSIGSSDASQHIQGTAADFYIPDRNLKEVHTWCDKMFPISGLGYYPSQGFIHIDNRGYRARW